MTKVAAMTATVETVKTMTVMVQTQAVVATITLVHQEAHLLIKAVPTLGGSPQVQAIKQAIQPHIGTMLLQNLTLTLALILTLNLNTDFSLRKLVKILLAHIYLSHTNIYSFGATIRQHQGWSSYSSIS